MIRRVKKRDGREVHFDSSKILNAIKKAFLANSMANNPQLFDALTDEVVGILNSRFSDDAVPAIEQIQDTVEAVLIKSNYTKIAKAYILYREKRKEKREVETLEQIQENKLTVTGTDGQPQTFDVEEIRTMLEAISTDLDVNVDEVVPAILKLMYNGITHEEIGKTVLNVVKTKIEDHYNYSYFSSRLVLNDLYKDILKVRDFSEELGRCYQSNFKAYIQLGVDEKLLNPDLLNYDFTKLSQAIDADRDKLFMFLGIQTITDRYLLRRRETKAIFELPQWMWMRVAMGLALKEKDMTERAIEFYNVLSNMYLVSSTPTLFNSGTTHSQMSSCYINVVEDSLDEIFQTFADCGQLSKWAGGIGTDWTAVRAKGSTIKGTNGDSQGIIPFVKIYNDVALAVNQGGKRRGAMAAYLEIWHRDVEEFLDLKKNTGDERRRAHDIHTALFICDLFMKRVREGGSWSLFSPDTVRDLHSSYGKVFEEKYLEYEKQDIKGKKTMPAKDLWKKVLTRLYETGHPWITFKDPMNVRSPQDHVGMVHSSNLCTEIVLNTSKEETAVCNLASINLSKMVKDGKLDEESIKRNVLTGIRMLDNVIDLNFYPIPQAKNANTKHRPVGLGVMGYQDALYQMEIDFDSDESLEFADYSAEMISYYAILASSKLAQEKGKYSTYEGSKWDRGIFPFDTVDLLEKERGCEILVDRTSRMDWTPVREHVKEHGMRNSHTMAIAPTATIANIVGTTPTIEPTFKNIYMKENLSGNFVVINRYLIDSLSELGLWTKDILNKIKLNNGSVLGIDEIPADIRRRFKEVFEIQPMWVIKSAALRAKWIDQSTSTNIFLNTTSGKLVNDVYMNAWEYGLKTTYYLRTLAASQVTKTVAVQEADPVKEKEQLKVCSIDDPDCEACQ